MTTAYRSLIVPDIAGGMRLDRFLARWFKDRSRTELVRAIREGLVCNPAGKPLRPSSILHPGDELHILIAGIAPEGPAPPFPPIVYEDDELVVIDKPAGLMCHPAGTTFTWAVIGLARARWPNQDIDLVHRIDRDTSGLLILTKTIEANRWYKHIIQTGKCSKEYTAILKGVPDWDEAEIRQPIGSDEGIIRIKMSTRSDGLPAHTSVRVLARHQSDSLTLVQCKIHTGRTHQIRVHLADAGYPLLGDRLYGVEPSVFLHAWEQGADHTTFMATGAPRHALHCSRLTLKRPDGGTLELESPLPSDISRWWESPDVLPLDSSTANDTPEPEQGLSSLSNEC